MRVSDEAIEEIKALHDADARERRERAAEKKLREDFIETIEPFLLRPKQAGALFELLGQRFNITGGREDE